MSERCNTCGQPLPVDTAQLFLALMRDSPGRVNIYRIDGTDRWTLTYGTAGGRRLPGEDVRALVAQGKLEQTYPGCTDCYSLPGFQRRAPVGRQSAASRRKASTGTSTGA